MNKHEDFSLRPISLMDAPLIMNWRNMEHVRANMYSDHLITEQEHLNWLSQALAASTAAYLVFEYRGRPLGFVSFSNISPTHGRSEWAFYLGETDVPIGAGAAMEFLALEHAFEKLSLRKLCCEVFSFNQSVIRMHEKFGFCVEGRRIEHQLKNGKYEDVILLAMFQSHWREHKQALYARCFGGRGKK